MVYLDYEIGSSTRIDQLRTNPSAQIIAISGGHLNSLLTFGTFGGSFIYLYRKFSDSKRFFRIFGSLFLSYQLCKIVTL